MPGYTTPVTYDSQYSSPFSDEAELLRLIVETAGEGIWVLNESGHTVFSNERMESFLAQPKGALIGYSPSHFIAGRSRKELARIESSGPSAKETELCFTGAQGDKVWLRTRHRPVSFSDGTRGTMILATDITEERKQQETLLQTELSYTTLFEDLPVPIWDEDFSEVKKYLDRKKEEGITDFRSYFVHNPDKLDECTALLVVNDINQAVVDLNEAESKEQVLREFRKLLTRKSAEYAIEQLVAITEGRTSCEFDAELLTFNRNIRYVHFRWTVVKGYEDTYKRVYLSTTDLTRRIIDENLALQHSNREKAVLLKEIHHRVKNNLQIITSLLNLQSNGVEDEATQDILKMSLNRILAMASVHEMLYRSNDFAGINYKTYLERLVDSLVKSTSNEQHNISVSLDVEELMLNINTSIPLGLLINELLTNSIKHGFRERDSGEIYLHMCADGDSHYLLEIGDNGNGIPEDLHIQDTETLGLQLVHSLVDQLSGEIRLDRVKPGTHFVIRFSDSEQPMHPGDH